MHRKILILSAAVTFSITANSNAFAQYNSPSDGKQFEWLEPMVVELNGKLSVEKILHVDWGRGFCYLSGTAHMSQWTTVAIYSNPKKKDGSGGNNWKLKIEYTGPKWPGPHPETSATAQCFHFPQQIYGPNN